MRVLVSGSHGLIGAALGEHLAVDGHTIVPLVRDAGGPPPVGGVAWQPEAAQVDRRGLAALGPYDAVVHLAGAGIGDRRWNAARRRLLVTSRVAPTRALAEAVSTLDPPPSVLVSASAVGYYGDRGAEVLDEDSPAGSGSLAELCAAWEEACAPASATMRVVHLRSGIVLSRRGGALAKQLPLFRFGLGGRLGSGRQYVSWISLADEVSVVRRVIDDERLAGPCNATAPAPVTNGEFTRALGAAVGRPAVVPVPRLALRIAFGQMADEVLLASQRVLPARLDAIGHRFAHPTLAQALADALADGGEVPGR